MPQRNSN
jgi:hypothetical protein